MLSDALKLEENNKKKFKKSRGHQKNMKRIEQSQNNNEQKQKKPAWTKKFKVLKQMFKGTDKILLKEIFDENNKDFDTTME
jgi:hypothetical protein